MKENIKPLTGIRAFASLWVLLMHLYSPLLKGTIFYPFASSGFSGVTLFFILSGFILSYVYQGKFNNINFILNYKEFIFNRFARIYPLHLACLIYVSCFYLLKGNNDISIFLYNIFLVQGWGIFGFSHASYDAAAWSISVEFFCYILFPFLIFAFNKINNFMLAIVIIIFCYISYKLTYEDYSFYFKSLFQSICWGDPLGRFYCGKAIGYYGVFFVIGACLYHLVKKLPEGKFYDYGCLISFSLLFYLFNNEPYTVLFNFLSVIYGTLIFCLYKTTGFFKTLFGNAFVVYLGEISFALYMTHEWTMQTILYFSPSDLHSMLSWLAIFPSLIVAIFLYHFVEMPSRKYLRTFFKNFDLLKSFRKLNREVKLIG